MPLYFGKNCQYHLNDGVTFLVYEAGNATAKALLSTPPHNSTRSMWVYHTVCCLAHAPSNAAWLISGRCGGRFYRDDSSGLDYRLVSPGLWLAFGGGPTCINLFPHIGYRSLWVRGYVFKVFAVLLQNYFGLIFRDINQHSIYPIYNSRLRYRCMPRVYRWHGGGSEAVAIAVSRVFNVSKLWPGPSRRVRVSGRRGGPDSFPHSTQIDVVRLTNVISHTRSERGRKDVSRLRYLYLRAAGLRIHPGKTSKPVAPLTHQSPSCHS